jgi:CheY-like chemotaxis protein
MTAQALKVLLIEDTAEFAELVHKWLSPKGDIAFILSWSDSLMQGLNSLSEGNVDVILLDLGLPDSNGYEKLAGLPNLESKPKNVVSQINAAIRAAMR